MVQQITVFGATGRTGSKVIDQAGECGWKVVGVANESADPASEQVTHIEADVLNDDLTSAIAGSDAVISCLGVGNDPATLNDPPPSTRKGLSGSFRR